MTRTARTIAIGAVTAAAALLLSGCGLLTPPERFSDDATLDDQVHTIEIDQPAGSVTVRGDDDATEVEVSRTVSYHGDREVGSTFEVDGGVLVLSGCGHNCTVDYSIALPTGVDVRGATSNGAIELTKVGEVDVSTNNGGIELDDVAGAVEVETSNGRIEGLGLAGTGVRASTSNGAIELRLDAPQDVDARTSNGAIDLAVPTGGAGYRVTTDTSNGSVDVDIDEDSDGEFTLDLATSNGAIRVTGR
ncbi:DUF4097 family beta strand repeat-containing protein [Agromyces cerinus]|uniref:Putative adhesin n=1 Tax=Agromyces cerinus subsp. cerinus TaxID=232089 RepID=A0A1N6GG57_9MICO|nr:DUF4097 family beta strand repeat-containing protein [Agromyces cerinus]SIO06392.1 Putative adhesin [Agromyces cerinus subsp. cerinus]